MRESMVVGKVYGRGLPGPTDGKSVAQNNPVLVNHPNTVDIGRAKDLTPEADAQIDDMFEYHKWAEEQVASGKHIREALAHAENPRGPHGCQFGDHARGQVLMSELSRASLGFDYIVPVPEIERERVRVQAELDALLSGVRALHDRVAIRVTVEGERKEGSMYVPDTAKGHPNEGRVIAVGPGWRDKKGRFYATTVKVGDYVVYGPYDGEERDGIMYIREDKILYVLEGV
jgi:chaperonin GroES